MEEGKDTKELVKLYYDVNQKLAALTKKHEKMKATLEAELKSKKKQLEKIQIMIKKQQAQVLAPLIEQVSTRENELVDLRTTTAQQNRHVKMLTAILRFPHVTEQFRRISKNRMTEKQLKETQKAATFTLRQYGMDDDPQKETNAL